MAKILKDGISFRLKKHFDAWQPWSYRNGFRGRQPGYTRMTHLELGYIFKDATAVRYFCKLYHLKITYFYNEYLEEIEIEDIDND